MIAGPQRVPQNHLFSEGNQYTFRSPNDCGSKLHVGVRSQLPDFIGLSESFNFEKGSWFFNKDVDIRNNQKVIEYKKPKTDLIPQ